MWRAYAAKLRHYEGGFLDRGYLVGSGWKDYKRSGSVCGHALPAGLREADKLPQPLFTPSTKATEGHDANIDRAAGVALVGEERFDAIERLSIELYRTAADYALVPTCVVRFYGRPQRRTFREDNGSVAT